jgi:hypothetical protein
LESSRTTSQGGAFGGGRNQPPSSSQACEARVCYALRRKNLECRESRTIAADLTALCSVSHPLEATHLGPRVISKAKREGEFPRPPVNWSKSCQTVKQDLVSDRVRHGVRRIHQRIARSCDSGSGSDHTPSTGSIQSRRRRSSNRKSCRPVQPAVLRQAHSSHRLGQPVRRPELGIHSSRSSGNPSRSGTSYRNAGRIRRNSEHSRVHRVRPWQRPETRNCR